MPSEVEERFRANLERVRNIVGLYATLAGTRPGRPSVQESDLLRAAVVLLHATLEDLLRSLARARLHRARPEFLAQIPLAGSGPSRKPTFTLGDLAAYRGMQVDEIIAESAIAYLERSNYNNVGDLKSLLEAIGIPPSLVGADAGPLAAMMQRRHLIAHRADRNEQGGRGQHPARSIARASVEAWIKAVERLGSRLIAVP